MKIITFKDIADLKIQPSVCLEWAESMIKFKNKTLLPPKISLKLLEGTFCNVMHGMILGLTKTN